MPARRVEGAALLIAGHGAPGVGAFDASVVHTLGQIGEALLATGSPWHVRRLTATLGDRYSADRKMIKRSLASLIEDPVRVGVIVLLGEVIEFADELALVTGAEAHEYPEDATLPLSWIRDRIASAKAERMVIAMSGCGVGTPARWLAALGTQREDHMFAVDAPTNGGNPMIDALLAGLCGDALDRATGTVTMASLSKHLAGYARAIKSSTLGETVAQPPPLAGFWDVRQSQLARPRPKRGPDVPEDLTGIVLPGRFRIDKFVARGTFGTVYRARQLAVERDVAIKVLHADIDPGSGDGKLFVEEIRAVGRIRHANVVGIHQADITHDGRLFFAMELLDGQDLQTLGTPERLPKERAIDLVRQLLGGLGSAHEAGLVHADIKPANAIVIPAQTSDDPTATVTRERAVLVDFGLARLRPPDRSSAESAGGTPAYMAPEQLNDGRVDARSDLFSISLVLVWLLTGWRRPNASTLIPPVKDLIEDGHLKNVLLKALDADPAKRFQTARELSAALAGNPAPPAAPRQSQELTPIKPFRHLAPLDKGDRLHGREADVATITEHALYRRAVVYAAPSGTGKTSVLSAGLLPRLEALGIHAVYVRCRTDFTWSVVKAIAPGATSIADAITKFHDNRGGKLVLVVDQLEAALADPEFVPALLGFEKWPAGADVSIVLSIREDWLARLLARTQEIEANLPIVRLPPLSPDGAKTAIVAPLAEYRLGIEPELLDALLVDLQKAAAAIGSEMGWGNEPAVFPPHLQLACSVLHESMTEGATTLSLDDYRRLGRFDAIVGEHLDNVIETELDETRALIARDIFLELVTSANQRAIRAEDDLLSIVGAKHNGTANVNPVLEVLRSRGLVVRVRGDGGASWELVHDSLVARVLSWIDKKDLARRRAIELVRHHLRRSSKEAPSLLSRKELRELAAHKGAVEELDEEYKKREAPDVGWMPTQLVARSRSVLNRTVGTVSGVVIAALLVGGFGFYRSRVREAEAREQADLRDRDLGIVRLKIEAFDWDVVQQRSRAAALPELTWKLHAPDPKDLDQPGAEYGPEWLVHGQHTEDSSSMGERIEAHGGRAFFVVSRTGCGRVVVPVQRLPGYANRTSEPELLVRIPTCQATSADGILIPAGEFLFHGVGEPPTESFADFPDFAKEQRMTLPAFRIDRTEVTNAQFAVFAELSTVTGISMPAYPKTTSLATVDRPRVPVTSVEWKEARAFCQFFGKELPTTAQWTKAMRGGLEINGAPNPAPRRNLPWGMREAPVWLKSETIAEVGTHTEDTSPYGVADLAANVSEWTNTKDDPGVHVIRGGDWYYSKDLKTLLDTIPVDNPRDERKREHNIGFRCAGE